MKRIFLFLLLGLFVVSFVSADLTDGLVSYYKADETSGVIVDSHGSNNGTRVGLTRGVTGVINNSYDLEHNFNQHFYTADDDSLDFTDEFSVNMWVNFESFGWGMYNKGALDSSVGDYALATSSFQYLVFRLNGATTVGNGQVNSGNLTTGVWYMVTTTYNKTQGIQAIYINGVLNNTESYSTSLNVNADNFYVGQYWDAGQGFDGQMDEIGVWNRSLNATEINDLYNGSFGLSYDNFTAESPPVGCSILDSGNYTVSNGYIFADPSSSYLYSENVTISYNYSASGGSGASQVMSETTDSLSAVPQWFSIILVISAMVVLILLTVLIVQAIRRSGLIPSA